MEMMAFNYATAAEIHMIMYALKSKCFDVTIPSHLLLGQLKEAATNITIKASKILRQPTTCILPTDAFLRRFAKAN